MTDTKYDQQRKAFERFMETKEGSVNDHADFIASFYKNAVDMEADWFMTDLAKTWLGNLPKPDPAPLREKLCAMSSASVPLSATDQMLWKMQVPQILTEDNGWIFEGPRYAASMVHPVTGKNTPALQSGGYWCFYHEAYDMGVSVYVSPHDGSLSLEVYYNIEKIEMDDAITQMRTLVEEPNPFRNEVCRLTTGGMSIIRFQEEKLSPYDDSVEDAVSWMTKIADPDVVKRLHAANLPARAGMLLEGPPGSGKTTLVRRIARDLRGVATVIYVDSEVPAGEALDLAAKFAPAMFVFEDVEGFIGNRGDGDFSRFLNAVDGVDQRHATMILATTNDSEGFDPAVRRPGRLETRVVIESIHPEAKLNMLRSRFPDESSDVLVRIMEVIESKVNASNKPKKGGSRVTPAVIDSLCRHALMLDLSGEHIIAYAENKWEPYWEGADYIDED